MAQTIDCNDLEKLSYTANLTGREVLVIYNALALMSQNELTGTCEDCLWSMDKLLSRFDAFIQLHQTDQEDYESN